MVVVPTLICNSLQNAHVGKNPKNLLQAFVNENIVTVE